ncbi:MAG: hypothetical protein GY833_02585 [Aestuariibacter sp.]|nr:hypothetical protein [Aestuariibacter sp.]
MSIEDKLRQNVVLVRREEMVGTGFFIGNDGSLLTCFHVVGDMETGNLTNNELTATFNEREYVAECIYASPIPRVLDMAVLRLAMGKLPPEATLLPLGEWKSDLRYARDFCTLGFRSPRFAPKGLYARGEIRGPVTVDNAPLLQLESEAVGAEETRQGMSGAPVYHESTGQVVGMITRHFKKQGEETIPLAVPIKEMGQAWLPIQERVLEEKLLTQLLEILQSGQWFTEKAFEYFYRGLPIPGLVRYDELGQDKSQALIEQTRSLGNIYDLINCFRVKRPDIQLTGLNLPPVHRINFVNRADELKEACDSHAPQYILFDAPAGYGKTELLKTVEQRHFRDNWLCTFVEIPQDVNSALGLAKQLAAQAGYPGNLAHFSDVKAVGHRLGGFFDERLTSLKSPGVILLVDNIERLPHSEIDAFLSDFLVAVQSPAMRVRLAGRYVGSIWEKQAKKHNFTFKVIPLTPFRFRYVKDTVRLLLPSQAMPDLCAAHLMHVTGGHPGCMAKIIEHMSVTQSVEQDFALHQDEYKKIVLSVAHEIRESIPEPLRDIFDVLSVFRRYNYRLLQQIIDTGLIEYVGGADNLEKVLTATYLVKRRRGFIQDEIVRRLLALRLRWEETKRFIELCEKARQIYEQDSQKSNSRSEFIVIEGLYQELRLGYYQGRQTLIDRDSLRNRFFADDGILHQYLKILAVKSDTPDIKANLKTALEDENSDWEFQFAVNFFLRGENQYSDKLYKQLLDQVKGFFAYETGGTDD